MQDLKKLVDIHKYYRTGGVDWGKVGANFDAIIISAGVGMSANPLLKEQVDGAVAYGIPYMTYYIPSPEFGISAQVRYYLSLYGVRDSWTCEDIESPTADGSVRCVNATEARAFANGLADGTGTSPLMYSNQKYIVESLKNPSWMGEYSWWIAQWMYWFLRYLYRDFGPFLSKWASKLPTFPPYSVGKSWQSKVVGWQFTCKGDAQKLCASYRTNDPVYKYGMKDADLNIFDGMIMGMLNGEPSPIIPPEYKKYRVIVDSVFVRKCPSRVCDAARGGLSYGNVVTAYESIVDSSGNPWIKISDQAEWWACVNWVGNPLMVEVQ